MKKETITAMINMANELDKIGMGFEADRMTKMAYDFSNPAKEELVDDSLKNSDDHQELQEILEEMSASGEITDEQVKHILEIVDEGDVSSHSWEKESVVDNSLALDLPDTQSMSFDKKNYSIRYL
jgi:hypothetical protein